MDAGGTSFKYRIIEDSSIEDFKLGPANINNDFLTVYNTFENIFNESKFDKGVFGVAGYASLAIDKKEKINDLISKHVAKYAIMSDAQLPLFSTDREDVVAVTCGTGTAIFKKRNGQLVDKHDLGFGWAIGDPLSGFEIGRGILSKVLMTKDQKLIDEVNTVLGLDKGSNPVKYLWSNMEKMQVNIGKLPVLRTSDEQSIQDIANKVVDENVETLLEYLKSNINPEDTILLNGGIFNNIDSVVSALRSTFKNEIIVLEENALDAATKYLGGGKW